MQTIDVVIRTNYGSRHLYPGNPGAALLARLVGAKTLTIQNLAYAQALGFDVVIDASNVERERAYADIAAECIAAE